METYIRLKNSIHIQILIHLCFGYKYLIRGKFKYTNNII